MSGKRIVFATFGSLGDLHPYVAVARELVRRGHRPLIASFAELRDAVETAGIAFAPQIIAHTSLRNSVLTRVNPNLDGKLILGQTSLGWFSLRSLNPSAIRTLSFPPPPSVTAVSQARRPSAVMEPR